MNLLKPYTADWKGTKYLTSVLSMRYLLAESFQTGVRRSEYFRHLLKLVRTLSKTGSDFRMGSKFSIWRFNSVASLKPYKLINIFRIKFFWTWFTFSSDTKNSLSSSPSLLNWLPSANKKNMYRNSFSIIVFICFLALSNNWLAILNSLAGYVASGERYKRPGSARPCSPAQKLTKVILFVFCAEKERWTRSSYEKNIEPIQIILLCKTLFVRLGKVFNMLSWIRF